MKNNKTTIFSLIIIILFLIPIISISIFNASLPSDNPKKSVWASLYTWYGVPGEPAGKYGYPEWQKNASEQEFSDWNFDLSTMKSIQTNHTNSLFRINGEADEIGQELVLCFNYSKISNTRMYVELNLTVGNLENSEINLEVYGNGFKYNTSTLKNADFNKDWHIINKVLFVGLNRTSISYNMGKYFAIILQAKTVGNYSLGINYIEGSAWTHYNEDYHTYADNQGFYYNDPPVHLATAHRVYYNGNPWSEIPRYGIYNHSKWSEDEPLPPDKVTQYGIYDSLNSTVIQAQLMLMEKAGIDVCQIMHPWGVDVVELIFDIAEKINSNLTFTYYTGRTINQAAKILEKFGNSKYFYRIDDKAVITWGYTGGLNEPYQVMYQKAVELKKAYDVYLVADLYSSRYITKEEMLYVYDCWYYYDTSAFYRHGYGDPRIENYQADGSLYPLNAWDHLDRLFGSLSSLAHSHGKDFCAIVIPGTDNTPVHDFIGSPLYDGRTGTINKRENGLTFNETWQAAIDANSDFVDIVSWNELHEGTEIEPTIENGTLYVEWNNLWAKMFRNN